MKKKHWRIERFENGRIHVVSEDGEEMVLKGMDGASPDEVVHKLQHAWMIRQARQDLKTATEIHANVVFDLGVKWGKAVGGTVSEKADPPALAETLFILLAPKDSAKAQLGDLQEMFESDAVRLGRDRARKLYWNRVARSLAPLIYRRLERIGFIGFLIDLGRKKLGL